MSDVKTKCPHTPGPWIAEPDGLDYDVRSEDYGRIVTRHCYPDERCDTCVEGDARLISAAPYMEKTLAQILVFLRQGMDQLDEKLAEKMCETALATAWGCKPDEVGTPDMADFN